MKMLFFFLFSLCLFTACKNNSLKPGEIIGGGPTPPNANDPNKPKSPWANNPGKGTLPAELRTQLMTGCLQQVGNDPQAQQKCDCWIGKIEARFPTAKAANEIPENIADDLARECLKNFTGTGDYDPNNPNDPIIPNNIDNPDGPNMPNNGGGNWTAQQRQQFIQGCAGSAQQNGLTAPQANSYCDCMTRKIEAKFTFEQAGRMTAADFQTPEWQQAGYDCYPKQQQYEY